MGVKIGYHLTKTAKERNIKQADVARQLNYAKTTVNGYFNGEPAPHDFIESVSVLLDDSEFNQSVAHQLFRTVPAMEAVQYHENPVVLDVIQKQQSDERKQHHHEAIMIMTKKPEYITEKEFEKLEMYADEFLDELLVETKLVIEILRICGKSIMTAVNERQVHWIEQGYIRK
ncbi:hypothetical protein [Atopococcus tabaci]|uniref:hypothetical protein n=1 Tax=Atopococcus tabaci TaxID=269774 RepID=UPI0024093A19|nr:hypothetical protein [Atopococcus tabaci]